MAQEQMATVYDFTYHKLMKMLDGLTTGDEIELMMQLIDGYLEGLVGVVWVSGEPRFFDVNDESDEYSSMEDMLQLEEDLTDSYFEGALDSYIEEAIEEFGLREDFLED